MRDLLAIKRKLVKISCDDIKIFTIGACLYICCLMIAASFNKTGLLVLEESFNLIKICGGFILAYMWFKHWDNFSSAVRISFFTFNFGVASLSVYNAYRTLLMHLGISYVFNFSYHFIVIALYLGQTVLIKNINEDIANRTCSRNIRGNI